MKQILALCILLAITGCQIPLPKGLPPYILADDSTPSRIVKVGSTLGLKAMFHISSVFAWSVDQPTLASIESDPKNSQSAALTGIKPGLVTVTAKTGDNKAKIEITIIPAE
jgi:hypothetical protein